MPKAIVLALLIGGAIFLVSAWFTQSLFPDVSDFNEESLENSALPQIALMVGGHLFQDPAHLGGVRRHHGVEPGLARLGVAAALRHGRNGRGPVGRFFGYLHPSFQTPPTRSSSWAWSPRRAIPLNLDFVASLINFGALIAFTFVNLTVIAYFAWRRREIRGAVQIFRNIVLLLIGWGSPSCSGCTVGGLHQGRNHLVLHRHRRAAVDHRFFRRPLTVNMGETHPITREG